MTPIPALNEFALIREVAEALNRDLPPDDALRQVADLLRRHFDARRAIVWRRAPNATRLVPIASPPLPASHRDEAAADTPGPRTAQVDLVHGGHALGRLEIEGHDAGGPGPAQPLLTVVAHVLSPFLDAVLLSEDLAAEVATRSRELQDQRRFIRGVIDALPVGLHVVDRDYRIQVWNRKRETGTQGMRRDQVVGRRVFDVLTRQPADQLQAEFDRIFETGETVQREHEVEIAGERRVFRQSRIPMRLDGDVITHVITFGEDVTERRLTEQRILQSEKLAAVGQLAAGVMHEINNPLATIGACVAAIESRLTGGADATVREYLEIIEAEVHRCTRIVDQLLDFSRPRPGPGHRRATDLNQLVDQTLFLLKHHQRFKRLTVERDFLEGLPPVLVDGERVIQAFMAILLNAADAMERGGRLRVRTARSPGRPGDVLAEFTDHGTGIPAAELARIFEPFFTTKPAGRGTGLGLTICYGIIE
ncbi:MAG TPA: PAS domain-containing protein, partial [Gemmatimonadales bacterium]